MQGEPGPHRTEVRVYYEDTDAGGIVFYANYLKFAERGRTEFLRTIGYDHRTVARDFGLGFVVRRCEIDYIRPAGLDDLLCVETRVTKVSGARFSMSQRVLKNAMILCEVSVDLGCVGASGRPSRLPEALRVKMMDLVHAGL